METKTRILFFDFLKNQKNKNVYLIHKTMYIKKQHIKIYCRKILKNRKYEILISKFSHF